MSRRRKKKLPPEPQHALVENLSHNGRGVARIDGKTVFIDRALPGEEVMFRYTCIRSQYDEGVVTEVLKASPHRIQPECEFFEVCGGCSLQHLDSVEQIRKKQSVLLEDFKRIGKVEPTHVMPSLTGPIWGYRQKARLGVRYVRKKERVLVGFREKHSAFLADMQSCKILTPIIGERLEELSVMIRQLSCYDQIAQIEVAIGDDAAALIFRHLVDLTEADREILSAFGQQYGFQIYLQPKGPDSIHLLWPDSAVLNYYLPDHDISLEFQPGDFTQVNAEINRKMVNLALQLLDADQDDRVLELFCGLGNFSLPLARRVGHVTAVEGDVSLIKRARQNAERNGISNVEFHTANLMEDVTGLPWLRKQSYDKVVLDPPRSGAAEMIPHIASVNPRRIVYVSCNPSTLARDTGMLVHEHGYKLMQAGVMDMFPHTAHVESIALFIKE